MRWAMACGALTADRTVKGYDNVPSDHLPVSPPPRPPQGHEGVCVGGDSEGGYITAIGHSKQWQEQEGLVPCWFSGEVTASSTLRGITQ